MCVMLIHRWPNEALSTDVIYEGVDGSPPLELGNQGAMTSGGMISGDYVEVDVDPSLTCGTVVNFLISLSSLLLS